MTPAKKERSCYPAFNLFKKNHVCLVIFSLTMLISCACKLYTKMAQMYPDFLFVPLPTQRLFIYLGSAITQQWINKRGNLTSREYNGGGYSCTLGCTSVIFVTLLLL